MFPAGPPMQSLQLENKSRATQQCAQPNTEPSNRPASLCCRQKLVLSVVTTCSETDFSFLGHSDFCLSRVQLILCLSHFFPTCSFSGNLECHQSQTRLHKLMLAKLNIVSMSYSYRELGSHIQYGTPALRRNLPKDFFCKQPPLPKHAFTVTTATPGWGYAALNVSVIQSFRFCCSPERNRDQASIPQRALINVGQTTRSRMSFPHIKKPRGDTEALRLCCSFTCSRGLARPPCSLPLSQL